MHLKKIKVFHETLEGPLDLNNELLNVLLASRVPGFIWKDNLLDWFYGGAQNHHTLVDSELSEFNRSLEDFVRSHSVRIDRLLKQFLPSHAVG